MQPQLFAMPPPLSSNRHQEEDGGVAIPKDAFSDLEKAKARANVKIQAPEAQAGEVGSGGLI